VTNLAATRRRLVARSVTGRYDAFLGLGGGLAVLGLLLFGSALGGEDAARTWHLFQVNWVYFTGLAGGSVALAAVHKVVNARWSGLIIRFAEASVAFLPVSLLGLVLIFTVGYPYIYGHMAGELHTLQHGKAVWLSHGVMFGRLLVLLVALYVVGWRLVRADMVPDMFAAKDAVSGGKRGLFERMTAGYDGSEGSIEDNERRIRRMAASYVVLYALAFTAVAFDGMMALQPHWFSNLFGGWYFMGSFLAGHMLLALLMIYGGRELEIADLISAKQRHDLGKLCFGFTVFWTYLMWAQFQVIWYGNLPEETGFVFSRLWGHWVPIAKVVFIGMFIIPFFGLLGVGPKKTRATLGFFAAVSLLALWLERYLLIVPSVTSFDGPILGLPEVGPTLLFAGLYLLAYAWFGRTFPMVSPRLAEITLTRELGHHAVEVFDHEDQDRDFVHEADLERRKGSR
jgi:Ni/Fe-hydrogenase subunit HybB-like protein